MSEAVLRPPSFALPGALALLVHVAAFGVLILGLTWQRVEPPKVIVELWSDLPSAKPRESTKRPPAPKPPELPRPARPPDVMPPAAPKAAEPAVPKEPPKPAPVRVPDVLPGPPPKPVEGPPPEVKKAETAVPDPREAERKRLEEAKAQEERARREERKRIEQAMRAEERRRAEDAKRAEAERLREEEARQREETERAENERKRLREAIKQQARVAEEMRVAAEMADSQRRAAAAAAIRVQRQIDDFMAQIRGKIRDEVRLPPGLEGNPQATFEVRLLKNGTAASVRLAKPSGVPAYDRAVERAIEKAQPLPVPDDLDLFEQLRDLTLVFRPND